MTYIPRSSLLPQNSPGAIPKTVQKRHTFRVFSFLGGMLISLSLLSATGVFLYKGYAEKQLVKANEALLAESASDNARKIEELTTFNTRLDVAYDLLNNHVAPSTVLAEFEKITKETVQLTKFKYTYDPGFDVFLEIGGTTKELSSVALQKIQFMKQSMFSKFVMHNISIGQKSTDTEQVVNEDEVQFDVKGALDKRLFVYSVAAPEPVAAPVEETVTEVPAEEDATEATPESDITQ